MAVSSRETRPPSTMNDAQLVPALMTSHIDNAETELNAHRQVFYTVSKNISTCEE